MWDGWTLTMRQWLKPLHLVAQECDATLEGGRCYARSPFEKSSRRSP